MNFNLVFTVGQANLIAQCFCWAGRWSKCGERPSCRANATMVTFCTRIIIGLKEETSVKLGEVNLPPFTYAVISTV